MVPVEEVVVVAEEEEDRQGSAALVSMVQVRVEEEVVEVDKEER